MNFKAVKTTAANHEWLALQIQGGKKGMMKQQIILFNKCIVLRKVIIVFTDSQFWNNELLFKRLSCAVLHAVNKSLLG